MAHGVYPPGTIDAAGPIMNVTTGYHHNWIVQILPYIEEQNAYNLLDKKLSIYGGLAVAEYLLADPTGRFLRERLLLKRLRPDHTWERRHALHRGARVVEERHVEGVCFVAARRHAGLDDDSPPAGRSRLCLDRVRRAAHAGRVPRGKRRGA